MVNEDTQQLLGKTTSTFTMPGCMTIAMPKTSRAGESKPELLPKELLRLVFQELTPADSLILKLVSNMFYYATLYADGTPVVRPLHPKDLRSEEALVLYANKLSSNVDFHAVRSLFDAADDWAGSKAIREAHARDLKRVNNILELGWHRQPLISFYCTHCSEVKDICHFPDCQRSSYPHGHPYLDGRTCLPCAFAMSPNGSRELFTLNSTAHKPCINCGKIDAESAFGPPDHDDGTTHEGVSACHMCHATKKAKGWALKFNRYGWEDFDVLDIFDYKAYVDSKGKVEQTLDGTTLAEAFDSHYAARALASKATDAAMGS